jgi:xanthine dehydrogenase small subunit
MHGCELVTVDDLGCWAANCIPFRQAMVEHHGSQCGFCTPGFVMSLFVLYHAPGTARAQGNRRSIAGNLCRCTGYQADHLSCRRRPVQAKRGCMVGDSAEIAAELSRLNDGEDVFCGTAECFAAIPARRKHCCDLAANIPMRRHGAGGTDVGLWITKQLRSLAETHFHGQGEASCTPSLIGSQRSRWAVP